MKTRYWLPKYQGLLKQLAQARKEAGLTQVKASEMIKKPQSFICKCELGMRRVDALELKMFSELYDKDLYYFFKDEE